MRIIILAIGILLMSIDTVAQDDWQLFKVEDVFSIVMPIGVETQTKELKTQIGILLNTAYISKESEDEGAKVYVVNTITYPEDVIDISDRELMDSMLVETIDAAAISVGGSVVYATPQSNKKRHSFLFRIKYNDGEGVVKGKAILSGRTFYMLQVYSTKADSLSESIDMFLDSFKLLLSRT